MALDFPALVQGTGALLELALAIWVFLVAPRSHMNRAFALFLYGVGLADLASAVGVALAADPGSADALGSAAMVGYLVAAASLVWFALVYPGDRRLTSGERWVTAGVFLLAIVAIAFDGFGVETVAAKHGWEAVSAALISAQGPVASWLSRHLGRGDPRRQESTRLIVLGVALWPIYTLVSLSRWRVTGEWPDVYWPPLDFVYLPLCALVAPAIWNLARRTPGSGRRWGHLAILGAVALMGLAGGSNLTTHRFFYGVTIFAMVALVTYGLLRYDLFTLDRKVRFAISKSTVAAVFIAVFFVVSEMAQEFFGARLDDTYLGILAAGMLIFAIAPLQRMADRLAAKAVPGATATSRHEESYRNALRLALRDRLLTGEERLQLYRLAEDLGIPAGRAAEIQLSIEEDRQA